MCGISGIVDFERPVARETLERMTAVLVHRGPDDAGLETRGAAGLGFRRLSIIDLAGSHQPMSNEDDSLWLLFNGEIYNYRALREELGARGHRFKTQGDGETILHLYEEHGLDFVHRLNGMFAIALWDERAERLVLARDRLGIKPLYYALDRGRLCFASETKALLQIPELPRTLDLEAIAGYTNYSSVPGELTCFREVRRLLPGHLGVFDRSGWKRQRWWDVSFDAQREWRPAELEERVEELLRDAVRLRMITDVPLGAFLSGGVDSSLVAALMAQESSKPVEAFSIGYGREGALMNELEYARAVARRWDMNHHELVLDSEDLLRDFDRVVWHLDEPCGDPAAFLTLALSRFARERVTVALSGVGADEVFGGYRRYLSELWRERWLRVPGFVREGLVLPLVRRLPESRLSRFANYARMARKFLEASAADPRSAWALTVSYLPPYEGPIFEGPAAAATRATFTSEAFEEYWRRAGHAPGAVDRLMYMDLHMYLVDQLLSLQDKMSMAVSLEARVPFLDYRLVELAATIPARTKLAGGTLKAVLKRIAEKHVPRECIYREKKGFVAPVEAWLRGPLRERVRDALSASRVHARGIFRPAFMEWLLRGFYEEERDLSVQLYQAFLLERWFELFVDARSPA